MCQGLHKKTDITSHIFNRENLMEGTGYTGVGTVSQAADNGVIPQMNRAGSSTIHWLARLREDTIGAQGGVTKWKFPCQSHVSWRQEEGRRQRERHTHTEYPGFSLYSTLHLHQCLPILKPNQEPLGKRGQESQSPEVQSRAEEG